MKTFTEYLCEAENSALKEYIGYVVNSLYSGDYEFSSARGGMIKPTFSANKAQLSVKCKLIQLTPDEVSDEFHDVADFVRQISGIHPGTKVKFKKSYKSTGFQEIADCSGSNSVSVDANVKIKMNGKINYNEDSPVDTVATFNMTFIV